MADVEAARLIIPVTTNAKEAAGSIESLNKSINKSTGSLDKFGKTSNQTQKTNNESSLSFSTLAKVVAGSFSVVALAQYAGSMLSLSNQIDNAKIAFTNIIGSAEIANQTISKLQKFGAETPFEFPGILETSKKLLAFGVTNENLIDTLKNLGNAASGNQAKLDSLALAYGKTASRGKASMEELNMFIDAGVPIVQALADEFGVTKAEIIKMSEQGKLSFASVDSAIKKLTTGTGAFAGNLEKQSKTLGGMWSTAKDNINAFAVSLIEQLKPAMIDVISVATDVADQTSGMVSMFSSMSVASGKTGESVSVLSTALKSSLAPFKALNEYNKAFFSVASKGSDLISNIIGLKTNYENGAPAQENFIRLLGMSGGAASDQSKQINKSTVATKDAQKAWNSYLGTLSEAGQTNISAQFKLLNIEMEKQKRLVGSMGLDASNVESFYYRQRLASLQQFLNESAGVYGGNFALAQENLDIAYEQYLATDATSYAERLTAQQLYNEQSQQLESDRQAYAVATMQQRLGMNTDEYKATVSIMDSLSTLMSAKNKKLFYIGKAAAIGRAGMNTAEGATKAFAQWGFPWGAIAAAAVIAAGGVQIANIASQQYQGAAFGGDFMVPPGFSADSAMLKVNSGENVSVTPSRMSDSSAINKGSQAMYLSIGGREFEAFQIDSMNKIVNNGSVQTRRTGSIKVAS